MGRVHLYFFLVKQHIIQVQSITQGAQGLYLVPLLFLCAFVVVHKLNKRDLSHSLKKSISHQLHHLLLCTRHKTKPFKLQLMYIKTVCVWLHRTTNDAEIQVMQAMQG